MVCFISVEYCLDRCSLNSETYRNVRTDDNMIIINTLRKGL